MSEHEGPCGGYAGEGKHNILEGTNEESEAGKGTVTTERGENSSNINSTVPLTKSVTDVELKTGDPHLRISSSLNEDQLNSSSSSSEMYLTTEGEAKGPECGEDLKGEKGDGVETGDEGTESGIKARRNDGVKNEEKQKTSEETNEESEARKAAVTTETGGNGEKRDTVKQGAAEVKEEDLETGKAKDLENKTISFERQEIEQTDRSNVERQGNDKERRTDVDRQEHAKKGKLDMKIPGTTGVQKPEDEKEAQIVVRRQEDTPIVKSQEDEKKADEKEEKPIVKNHEDEEKAETDAQRQEDEKAAEPIVKSQEGEKEAEAEPIVKRQEDEKDLETVVLVQEDEKVEETVVQRQEDEKGDETAVQRQENENEAETVVQVQEDEKEDEAVVQRQKGEKEEGTVVQRQKDEKEAEPIVKSQEDEKEAETVVQVQEDEKEEETAVQRLEDEKETEAIVKSKKDEKEAETMVQVQEDEKEGETAVQRLEDEKETEPIVKGQDDEKEAETVVQVQEDEMEKLVVLQQESNTVNQGKEREESTRHETREVEKTGESNVERQEDEKEEDSSTESQRDGKEEVNVDRQECEKKDETNTERQGEEKEAESDVESQRDGKEGTSVGRQKDPKEKETIFESQKFENKVDTNFGRQEDETAEPDDEGLEKKEITDVEIREDQNGLENGDTNAKCESQGATENRQAPKENLVEGTESIKLSDGGWETLDMQDAKDENADGVEDKTELSTECAENDKDILDKKSENTEVNVDRQECEKKDETNTERQGEGKEAESDVNGKCGANLKSVVLDSEGVEIGSSVKEEKNETEKEEFGDALEAEMRRQKEVSKRLVIEGTPVPGAREAVELGVEAVEGNLEDSVKLKNESDKNKNSQAASVPTVPQAKDWNGQESDESLIGFCGRMSHSTNNSDFTHASAQETMYQQSSRYFPTVKELPSNGLNSDSSVVPSNQQTAFSTWFHLPKWTRIWSNSSSEHRIYQVARKPYLPSRFTRNRK